MIRFSAVLVALSLALTIIPFPASANPVERACMQSDRQGASRALCRCVGQAADLTLSRTEMRQGARLFSDPQRAQDIRMSDRRSDERFWEAWRNFGDTAEAMCG